MILPMDVTADVLTAGLFTLPGRPPPPEPAPCHEVLLVSDGCLEILTGGHPLLLSRGCALVTRLPAAACRRPVSPSASFFLARFRLRAGSAGPTRPLAELAVVENPVCCRELFGSLVSGLAAGTLDELEASETLLLILCLMGCSRRATAASRGAPHGIADAVRAEIDARFRGPLGVSQLAKTLGFSPDYLERAFHAREGRTIGEAIHQRRIEAARTALMDGRRRSMREIGRECGYGDPGYFRKMFSRLAGMSPREFRALFRGAGAAGTGAAGAGAPRRLKPAQRPPAGSG